MLTGHDLVQICMHSATLRPHFLGVYARDTLPVVFASGFLIANTDMSSGVGQHWVLLVAPTLDPRRCWFDSLAETPNHYGSEFYACASRRVRNSYFANSTATQPDSSNTCGFHCLTVAYEFCLGRSYIEIMDMFDADDLDRNDKFVLAYANSHDLIRRSV